ncbi:MAG: glycine zipper 2TM domain-containing protein [Pseudomonadota bacterium]
MKIQITLLLTALGASALPAVQAAEFADSARVTRVEPRVEQVRQPREECRTEYVQAPAYQPAPQQERSAGGAIIGAIAGGILGHQVGGGTGRAAATAVGVMAGAVVGDKVANQGRDNQPQYAQQGSQEQAVRQCRMVDAWESRTVGYNVTYDYNGRSYTSIMDRDPGNRVRLRVSVEPEQMR